MTPLCSKCGKHPVLVVPNGWALTVCEFCAGENLNRAFTRFECVVCGKLTAGCIPARGDGTFRYPRRHNGKDGKPCPGNGREAEWVEFIPMKDGAK